MDTFRMGEGHWRGTALAWMRGEQVPSVWGQVACAPLWLASWVYGGLVQLHRVRYASGLGRVRRLPCRVVSIGNLTVGGTGKTPLTMWVARWLQQHGWRVVVLSRGYGARRSRPFLVVSTGEGPLYDWQTVGDEPYLLAQSLPGIPVLIGKNRYVSGQYACQELGAQVVVLDDGFQHRALARDLDVVLLEASRPFGHGALLPRGTLREPRGALRRAHTMILSRCEMAGDTMPRVIQQVSRYAQRQPLDGMTTRAEAVWQKGSATLDPVTRLHGGRVVAFAGIGNPQAFATTLAQLGSDVAALLAFPDHHAYTARDWQSLVDATRQYRATCLVTTEKDAVRLAAFWQAPIPVYALRIGVQFAQEPAALAQQLAAVMAHA